MSKLSYFIIIFCLFSCAEEMREQTTSKEVVREEPVSPKIDSTKIFQEIGRLELKSFMDKYESKWKNNKPENFPFSKPTKIKVFSLHSAGEYNQSEFTKRISSGIKINQDQLDKLLDILNSPESYGNGQAACYDPGFGLVIYDEEGVPSEWLSICLDCNRFLTYPGELEVKLESDLLQGFNQKAREKIRELIMKWGIDYYGYSRFYDDEMEYKEYLNQRTNK